MFDKLGDLLSDILEKGELPDSKIEKQFSDFSDTNEPSPIKNPSKIIPKNVKTALDFLEISEDSDYNTAKKIYREKLMYYHPDRRNENPVLQKVAKEKTFQTLKNWEIIENWFKSCESKDS